MPLPRNQAIVSWMLQLAAAAILLQTLYFKFTGAEESVYIFTTVGAEPWGRIGVDVDHGFKPYYVVSSDRKPYARSKPNWSSSCLV